MAHVQSLRRALYRRVTGKIQRETGGFFKAIDAAKMYWYSPVFLCVGSSGIPLRLNSSMT
jgi:hypothetical protein